ncbi:MAG: isochorismatase family protein [Bacteroidales bacterium]
MILDSQNTIGLVIDLQERIVSAMSNRDEVLANSAKLVSGLNILGIECLVSQQYTKGLGDTLSEISSIFQQFSFIDKKEFSCMQNKEFGEKLKANSGIKNIIICGVEAHVCVLQTAVDLKQADYNPIVVVDCIDSRRSYDKTYAIERFKHEGIHLATYESVLFEIVKTAGHDRFRDISKLIK